MDAIKKYNVGQKVLYNCIELMDIDGTFVHIPCDIVYIEPSKIAGVDFIWLRATGEDFEHLNDKEDTRFEGKYFSMTTNAFDKITPIVI